MAEAIMRVEVELDSGPETQAMIRRIVREELDARGLESSVGLTDLVEDTLTRTEIKVDKDGNGRIVKIHSKK